MVQQRNTKRHWTLLSVARYYEKFGEACRVRDLFPHVTRIHDDPSNLAMALSDLRKMGLIDFIKVRSPNPQGGSSDTFAYYPTQATRETLRDVGKPTSLPNHEPLPENANVEIPTVIVGSDEEPTPPSNIDRAAPEYSNKGSGTGSRSSPDPDSPRFKPADYDLTTMDSDNDNPDSDDTEPTETDDADVEPAIRRIGLPEEGTEYVDLDSLPESAIAERSPKGIVVLRDGRAACPHCERLLASVNGVGPHMRWCDERPEDDDSEVIALGELTEDDVATTNRTSLELPDGRGVCRKCGRVFDNERGARSHANFCEEEVLPLPWDEPEPEPEYIDLAELTEADVETVHGVTFELPDGRGVCRGCGRVFDTERSARAHAIKCDEEVQDLAAASEADIEPESEPTPAKNGSPSGAGTEPPAGSLRAVFGDGGTHAIEDYEALDGDTATIEARDEGVGLSPEQAEAAWRQPARELPEIAPDDVLAEIYSPVHEALMEDSVIDTQAMADALRHLLDGLDDEEETRILRRLANHDGISDAQFRALYEGFADD